MPAEQAPPVLGGVHAVFEGGGVRLSSIPLETRIAAILSIWSSAGPLYPERIDRIFLFFCDCVAFVVVVAWAYSTRFVTNLLGLEPPRHESGPLLVIAS